MEEAPDGSERTGVHRRKGHSMDIRKIKRILKDTAFPHVSGTPEELKVAQYLAEECRALGVEPKIEEFCVAGGEIKKAQLFADGRQIPCNGYLASGNADITAPFIHLREKDKASFTQVKDKIVILDGWLEAFDYKDISENGALGFIITNGNVNFRDSSPDKRFLAERIVEGAGGKKLPGMQIHVKDAAKLVKSGAKALVRLLDRYGIAPEALLDLCQDIEAQLGRARHEAVFDATGKRIYHDRVIDIDILIYNDLEIRTDRLTVPHPQLWERPYVKELLNDITI